ncbi:MAG: type II toxin-antitoxin system RelE/ParE family toxin [Lachnospiraceae bacterium]|nr:type II toxin-antitoxin system RelE/ParE family toxin [Lachnospiraceae bacterium]
MYEIIFYETAGGVSELWNYLDDLRRKAKNNKNARIQHNQIVQYIQLLEDHGTRLGEKITKHLEEDIWELRPGRNRVLFFYQNSNTYVLLHGFVKKTQKTPRREIEKAKRERDDWKKRMGKNENVERL